MKALDRRTVLRGFAGGLGATVALPLLEAMLNVNGTCLADGTPLPKRFGVWFWGNGVRHDRWVPAGTGTGSGWTLSSALQPLAAHRDYLSVASGLNVYTNPGVTVIGHHSGRYAVMSASYAQIPGTVEYGYPTLPSIDRLVADAWRTPETIDHLRVGVSRRGFENSVANGSTSFYPTGGYPRYNGLTYAPDQVYSRLFGTSGPAALPGDDTQDQRNLARRSVLDVVLADANRLRGRLGAADQQRLDHHMESIRSIEARLGTVQAPTQTLVYPNPDADAVARGGSTNHLAHEPLDDINMLMADLTAYALASGLTRVFTFEMTGMQTDTLFAGSNIGQHLLTHESNPTQHDRVHENVRYMMGRLAYLLERLRAYGEGGGNVLDNTCILATSEIADGHLHHNKDFPILLLGKAGGALKGNTHYRSPNGESTTKALLTALRAVDMPLAALGEGATRHTDDLPQLMA